MLRAPAGTVVTVEASDGERVRTGQRLATMQTAGRLWLKAAYYGTDSAALHVGMRGLFTPASGAAPIPIELAGIIPTTAPDGGQPVRLRRIHANAVGWQESPAQSH